MDQITFRELTDKMTDLYTEGNYSAALQLVEQNADRFPEFASRTTFWRMCLLSLCGRTDDVISVFQQGLDSGLWWGRGRFEDPDLNAVRDLPEFKRLMEISLEKYEQARTRTERDQTILVPDSPASDLYPLLIALHGGAGNKDSNLEYWEAARQKGWLVLSPQSTQPVDPGAYCWDDSEQGLVDLLAYFEMISKEYQIDTQRLVTAGFSQGSGMAIYAALSGKIPARGFIGIGTFLAEPSALTPLANDAKVVRGYFITGEKDHTLNKAREIQTILKENNIQFGEEVHPNLGHEFPPDFEKSFDKAMNFILKEHE
jgi:predicted esterase